jgi:hypothetical protein
MQGNIKYSSSAIIHASCLMIIFTGEKAVMLVTEQQVEFRELLASQKDRDKEQCKKQEEQLIQVCSKIMIL